MSLYLLAVAAESGCELNGQPIDCGVLVDKAKPFIGFGIGLLGIFLVFALISFVFWLLMLIHALNHNSPDKNTWILIFAISFFTGFSFIAAVIYFFAEKKKAEQALPPTSSPSAPPQAPQPPAE